MKLQSFSTGLACAAVSAALIASVPKIANALIVANTAGDVCAPAADPCLVTDVVQIVNGAVLDFGNRALSVSGAGQLDFGSGAALVRCGALTISTGSAIGINVRSGTAAAGDASIEVRRSCSGGAGACLSDADCPLGQTCSVGSGNASIDGRVLGDATATGSLSLLAAGTVQIDRSISFSGTATGTSGGRVTISSGLSSIILNDTVSASGGGFADGGTISLAAGGSISVNAAVDASGGDFDGGTVDIVAGDSVMIAGDILADSTVGEGFGGFIAISAGSDLSLVGGNATTPQFVSADGHGAAGFGGDGGEVELTAGGTISVGAFSLVRTRGAIPDGFGGDITAEAFGDIVVDGELNATARGSLGGGGGVDLQTNGTSAITIGATGLIDVSGTDAGGGDVIFTSPQAIVISGNIDATANASGVTGSVSLFGGASVSIDGGIAMAGTDDPAGDNFVADACAFDLLAGGLIDNGAIGGRNHITARAQIQVAAGAVMQATASGGENVMVHGSPAFAPVIAGTVTPAPDIVVDQTLPSCGSCASALECDDSNPCTDDQCDAVLGCLNVANTDACDDGLACTTGDVCNGGVCVGSAPAECDDSNPCTADSCSDAGGCTHAAAPALQCLAAANSKVIVKSDASGARNALSWKWRGGPGFDHGDLGNPALSDALALCIFDYASGQAEAAVVLDLPPNGAWTERSHERGWQYKDNAATLQGVRKVKLSPGAPGKARIQISARGPALPIPSPQVAAPLLDSDPFVLVQMRSDTGICWQTQFANPAKSTESSYKGVFK